MQRCQRDCQQRRQLHMIVAAAAAWTHYCLLLLPLQVLLILLPKLQAPPQLAQGQHQLQMLMLVRTAQERKRFQLLPA